VEKKTKNTKQTKKQNTTKYPKFKCNTISISLSACHCSSVVLLSKEEQKKKEKKKGSGDSSVNVCLRLQLTFPLLSACCCWRLYSLQISGVSLTLT
jgi:hypothetical protein